MYSRVSSEVHRKKYPNVFRRLTKTHTEPYKIFQVSNAQDNMEGYPKMFQTSDEELYFDFDDAAFIMRELNYDSQSTVSLVNIINIY